MPVQCGPESEQDLSIHKGDASSMPSVMDQIKLMQENMSLMLQKAEQEEEEMKILKDEANSLLQEKTTLESEQRDLYAVLYTEQQKNNRLQQENDVLEHKLNDAKQTIDALQRERGMLVADVQSMDAEVQGLELTLHESQQNNNSLKEQNNMLQDKVQSVASTLHQMEENINSLQQEKGTLDAQVEDLECKVYEREEEIVEMLDKMDTLNAKVQELKDTKLMHTHQIHDLKMIKEALQNTLYSSSYQIRYRSWPEKNGCALIINNTQFTTSEMGDRTGAEGDPQKLAEAFRSLPVNIEVKTYQDLDLPTMLSVLEEEANRDHTDEDFFICSIMTHGAQGKVYAANGYGVDILDIVSTFNGKRCPSLQGKPKLFFIQACQGDKHQSSDRDSTNSDASPSSILAYLSTEADFFLALATVPGYVAYRRDDGADFVNVLAKVLKEQGIDQDLMSMMAMASKELNEKYEYSPFCCTTLRRKLFFDHALEQSRFVN